MFSLSLSQLKILLCINDFCIKKEGVKLTWMAMKKCVHTMEVIPSSYSKETEKIMEQIVLECLPLKLHYQVYNN